MTKLENLEFRAKKLEKVPCPLCLGNKFQFVVEEHGLKIIKCLACGFIFCNPRPTKKELNRFYEQYYPEESLDLWDEQMSEIFLREGLFPIRKLTSFSSFSFPTLAERRGWDPDRSVGAFRVLDVGCGYGFFLQMLKNQGFQVFGTEMAGRALDHAKKLIGAKKIFEGELEKARFRKENFDVVSLWYVMEHLARPLENLKEAFRILRPNGLLILRLPQGSTRFDRLIFKFLGQKAEPLFLMNPPRHLNDFNKKTMLLALRKAGFIQIKIKNGIPRKTGTKLQIFRRKITYFFAKTFYYLSFGKIVSGSSMIVYARKK